MSGSRSVGVAVAVGGTLAVGVALGVALAFGTQAPGAASFTKNVDPSPVPVNVMQ